MAKFTDKDIFPETRDTWFEGIKSDGFTRKGLVGQWKNFFTEEKNEFCNKMFKEKMDGTGNEFDA